MASHPNGGISISGDIAALGDVSAQNVTASGTLSGGTTSLGATTTTASYIALTAGVTPTPAEGMIYANSTNHHLYYYSGSAWVQLDN